MQSVAVILGSAFHRDALPGLRLVAQEVSTPFGDVTLHRIEGPRPAFVLFRHGWPHRLLPHQIPWRAHAAALQQVRVGALLITSSVGLLDPGLPLDTLLPVGDLLMPHNRLPDGSACTMWPQPAPAQGHLVLTEGLFSLELGAQLAGLAHAQGLGLGPPVVFGYVGGPRTKTPAENRLWRSWGAQVNSMSVGPEVVLANELGIPVAALVVGHKHSQPTVRTAGAGQIDQSFVRGRAALGSVVVAFLGQGAPVPFANTLYRFGERP